jgi:hypothetical protein
MSLERSAKTMGYKDANHMIRQPDGRIPAAKFS